jgi:hypothetical protein
VQVLPSVVLCHSQNTAFLLTGMPAEALLVEFELEGASTRLHAALSKDQVAPERQIERRYRSKHGNLQARAVYWYNVSLTASTFGPLPSNAILGLPKS